MLAEAALELGKLQQEFQITTKLKLWSHHRFSNHDAIPFSSGVNIASDCMIAA